MQNPFTGDECVLKTDVREVTFRDEVFKYKASYWYCKETEEEFTTTEMDGESLRQVYDQYRKKHNLPSPEQLIAKRLKLGLSITLISKKLGIAENQYQKYENGTIPSEKDMKLITEFYKSSFDESLSNKK